MTVHAQLDDYMHVLGFEPVGFSNLTEPQEPQKALISLRSTAAGIGDMPPYPRMSLKSALKTPPRASRKLSRVRARTAAAKDHGPGFFPACYKNVSGYRCELRKSSFPGWDYRGGSKSNGKLDLPPFSVGNKAKSDPTPPRRPFEAYFVRK